MEKDEESGAKTLNDLPLEILLEIFCKLPIKEVYRIKIVCKLWSSHISHRSFRSEYSVRRNSYSLTLFLNFNRHCSNSTKGWLTQSPRVSLNFLPETVMKKVNYKSFHALISSNGLILWSNIYTCSLVVCNPLTKQWLTLPSPSNPGINVLSGFVCSELENGSTQLKVVRIARDPRIIISNILDIEIFESATNQWRQLTKTLDIKVGIGGPVNGVEIGGTFYWVNRTKNLVIAFDSNHDICFWFSLPGPCFPGLPFSFNRMLEKSGDHLYYVLIDFDAPNIPFTIWRCDAIEGKHTWTVHGLLDFDLLWNHQTTRLYPKECNLLAIDPVDCNILYLSWNHKESDSYIHRVYTLDVARRKLDEICSFPEEMGLSPTMFVEPTWPTKI